MYLYTKHVKTTDAGRLGEAKTIARLTELGWYPFLDLSGKCPIDIIAYKDGVVKTIQVKTTGVTTPSGKYVVQIGSTRPNRTENIIKKFDVDAQDYLAVYIIDTDVVVFIPAKEILSGRSLVVESIDNTTL